MIRKGRQTTLFFLALFVFAACYGFLVIYLSPQTRSKSGIGYDLFKYYYQMYAYGADEVLSGHFPLWNPWQACGAPFMATHTVGLLYPLHVAHLLMPTHIAMAVTFILHLTLISIFTYLCAREFGVSPFGSLLAAITFMFSGHVVWHIFQPCNYHAAIWVPLMLYLTKRICDKPTLINTLLLSLFSAVQFMAGFAQYYVYTLYVMLGYVSFHIARRIWKAREYRASACLFGYLLFAGLLTIGLTAVQLFPTAEMSFLSCRSPQGITDTQVAEIRHIVSAAHGYQLSGGIFLKNFFGIGLDKSSFHYAGLLPLLLLPFAWANRPQRFHMAFLTITILFCSLIAMIDWCGWMWVLRIPTISMFRIVTRIMFVAGLCFALIAGIGWDDLKSRLDSLLGESDIGGKNRGLWWVVVTGLILTLPMVWSHRSQVGRSAFVLISFALAFMALCLRQSRWQLWLAQLAIVITLLIDLTSIVFIPAAFPANALDAFRRLDGVWEFLREHEGHDRSYFDSVVGEKYGQLKHVRTVTDYEPFSSRRLRDFMAFLQREPFPENHAFYGTFWALLPETARMKLVNIMAVRYVFIYQPAWFEEWWDAPPAPLRLVYEEDRVRIYENPAALPRAYVVHAVRAIADETALLEALDAPSFDPSREVLLTEQPEAMEEGGAGMDPDVPADVRFVRDDPEEVELLVRSKRPGFLVLSDSDYPGWVATVNGKPARIYRANYLFRAVPVGEGESTVVFRYEPASFRWGMRISLIAAAVWLVAGTGAVVSRRKRRKRTPG